MKSVFSFKAILPQTLMGRSLLILVLPVIITQLIAAIVFFDNHWDKITDRLAFGLAGEIAIAAEQIESDYTPERLKMISGLMAQQLDILISFEPDQEMPPSIEDYNFRDWLVIGALVEALHHQVRRPSYVVLDMEEKYVEIKVQLENGVLTILSPERRLFTSSGYVFLISLIGSSIALLLISILFMRNQIRPIRRLAIAAERFGKGRDVPNFKFGGAREVRHAAEAFETMHRRIRRQIEQRTFMLAGVSHDLRTPLTRLKLQASMLEEKEEAAAILKDVGDMERMINAYLDFARGEKNESIQSIDLDKFIEDLVSSFSHTETSIEITNTTEKPIQIMAQPVNLNRCLGNLISNACSYADQIHIEYFLENERVYILIEDNGPGIPEAQFEDVFKPFVRLDSARSTDTGGAGLGLSVAMDIILSHGGKISLGKSEKLSGLKVSVRLPI